MKGSVYVHEGVHGILSCRGAWGGLRDVPGPSAGSAIAIVSRGLAVLG